MLCRHRVKEFSKWHEIFLTNMEAAEKAGFRLLHLLRDTKDPNYIVYLFALKDLDSALAFTQTPEAEDSGEKSGIVGEAEMFILSDEI